uniref:Putative secreted peptide n=1 Tax=Anopheles braziliensis TaxID=58242 RepID=A0A2M3ZSN7_9DIPT
MAITFGTALVTTFRLLFASFIRFIGCFTDLSIAANSPRAQVHKFATLYHSSSSTGRALIGNIGVAVDFAHNFGYDNRWVPFRHVFNFVE